MAQFVPGSTRVGYLRLNEIDQNVGYPFWHRRLIVTPAPDRHFRATERSGRGSVATKEFIIDPR
jgi:hypothetical protein